LKCVVEKGIGTLQVMGDSKSPINWENDKSYIEI
jgi:hypothetical protein